MQRPALEIGFELARKRFEPRYRSVGQDVRTQIRIEAGERGARVEEPLEEPRSPPVGILLFVASLSHCRSFPSGHGSIAAFLHHASCVT